MGWDCGGLDRIGLGVSEWVLSAVSDGLRGGENVRGQGLWKEGQGQGQVRVNGGGRENMPSFVDGGQFVAVAVGSFSYSSSDPDLWRGLRRKIHV